MLLLEQFPISFTSYLINKDNFPDVKNLVFYLNRRGVFNSIQLNG